MITENLSPDIQIPNGLISQEELRQELRNLENAERLLFKDYLVEVLNTRPDLVSIMKTVVNLIALPHPVDQEVAQIVAEQLKNFRKMRTYKK
jgi:hypothetical protein